MLTNSIKVRDIVTSPYFYLQKVQITFAFHLYRPGLVKSCAFFEIDTLVRLCLEQDLPVLIKTTTRHFQMKCYVPQRDNIYFSYRHIQHHVVLLHRECTYSFQ